MTAVRREVGCRKTMLPFTEQYFCSNSSGKKSKANDMRTIPFANSTAFLHAMYTKNEFAIDTIVNYFRSFWQESIDLCAVQTPLSDGRYKKKTLSKRDTGIFVRFCAFPKNLSLRRRKLCALYCDKKVKR